MDYIQEARIKWREELEQEKKDINERLEALEKEKVILEMKYSTVARVNEMYNKEHFKDEINVSFLEPLDREIDRVDEAIEEATTEKKVKGRILQTLIDQII